MSFSPHFDGPMIAGGSAYDLAEAATASPPKPLSTGLPWLDETTGGIEPGAVWALSGPPGIGVTRLAMAMAAGASQSGDVILCNGHIATRRVAAELLSLRNAVGDGAGRLRVASWYPLLGEPGSDAPLGESCDVLLVDTWDEAWHGAPRPASLAELIRRARWLRFLAREQRMAVVLTARLSEAHPDDPVSWSGEAFDDVADVRIAIGAHPTGARVLVRPRGASPSFGRLLPRPSSRYQLVAE